MLESCLFEHYTVRRSYIMYVVYKTRSVEFAMYMEVPQKQRLPL